jgi:hypothetical protein
VKSTASDEGLPKRLREGLLYRENNQLKQALGEKTLEVDFFKGALQKVAARRRQNAGAKASTSPNVSAAARPRNLDSSPH